MRVKLYMCGGEESRRFSSIPLSLGYLKANCPGDVEIVGSRDELTDCDLIGLSALAWGTQEAVEIARTSSIPVVLGGQATLWQGVQDEPFKHIVVGEGEVAFARILRGEVPATQRAVKAEPVDDLDTLAFPDRGECNEQVPIITSRGCPFACTFCSSRAFWGKPRYHSAEYVVEETRHLLARYPKMTTLRIMDDLFLAQPSRFDRMHNLWLRHGLHKRLRLRALIRSSHFDYGVAVRMKEMGFVRVRFGAETASDDLLRSLKKQTTVEQHQRAIDAAIRAGLEVSACFMYDIPGETEKDRAMTRNFIEKNKGKLEIEGRYRFRPFPGSACWDGESPLDTDMRFARF